MPRGIPGVSYPPCWYELLEWDERLTPHSRPCRVARRTLLPTQREPLLGRLVEVPLNADTDDRQLYLDGRPVSRSAVLDFHAGFVRKTGRSSCVCLGVHDAYLGGSPRRASVLGEIGSSLGHVRRIARRGEVPVRFVTASEVSALVHADPAAW